MDVVVSTDNVPRGSRHAKHLFWKAADMAGFAVPLGLAFGRMGCLMAGCCFGETCALPWAISFPGRSPASEEQFKDHLRRTLIPD